MYKWRITSIILLLLLARSLFAAPFTYISNGATGSVSVIDLASNSQIGSLLVGNLPSGVTLNPAGNRLYVANTGDDTVTVIDLTNGNNNSIAVGSKPVGIAGNPAGTRVYVANTGSHNVSVIDIATDSVIATVTVGTNPFDLAASDAFIYVANFADDTVSVIDTASNNAVATIPTPGFPMGIAINTAGDRVYVAAHFDSKLYVIDTASNTILNELDVGIEPRGVTVNAAGGQVYVSHFGSNDVGVADAALSSITTINSGQFNPTDITLSPNGDTAYVINAASQQLSIIDTATNTISGTIPVFCCHLAASGFSDVDPTAFVVPPPNPALSTPSIPSLNTIGLLILIASLAIVLLVMKRRQGAVLSLVAGIVILGLTPTPSEAQQFVINDTEFTSSDWEIFQANVFGGTQTAIQDGSGGNPDSHRRMQHWHTSEGSIEVFHRYIGSANTFDPSANGPITTIDISWDRGFLEAPDFTGASISESFVLFQNGTAYQFSAGTFSQLGWQNFSRTGLNAADFASGPDFSAAGAPITFGYRRSSTGFGAVGASERYFHGMDNFQLTVTFEDSGGGDAGTIKFQRPTYSVIERIEETLTLQRIGGNQGAVQVQVVELSGGTATSGDYVSLNLPAILNWADGDMANKTFTISTYADEIFENTETLHLRLEIVSGTAQADAVNDKAILYIYDSTEVISAAALLIAAILDLFLSSFNWLWICLLMLPTVLLLYWRWLQKRSSSSNKAVK